MRSSKLLWLLFTAVAGCTTSGSKLASCQAEKEQLLTTIRSQRDTARTLNEKLASTESRLDQAEKELARSGGTLTRLSSLPPRATDASSPAAKSDPLKNNTLPWRSPAGNAETSTPTTTENPRPGTSSSTMKPRGSLAALAKRDSRVRYDATTRAAEITSPVQFDNQSATISAAGKRQLDEVARLLRSDEARDLPIVVAAPDLARAKSVAEYLDRHGIPEERLAVSTTPKQSAKAPQTATSGGVQVFLLDSDAAVAEWGVQTGLRR
jgi:outer membrane protein OmpA-like peptidoglycan-associated protein